MNEQLIVPALSLNSKAETATASTKAKRPQRMNINSRCGHGGHAFDHLSRGCDQSPRSGEEKG